MELMETEILEAERAGTAAPPKTVALERGHRPAGEDGNGSVSDPIATGDNNVLLSDRCDLLVNLQMRKTWFKTPICRLFVSLTSTNQVPISKPGCTGL